MKPGFEREEFDKPLEKAFSPGLVRCEILVFQDVSDAL